MAQSPKQRPSRTARAHNKAGKSKRRPGLVRRFVAWFITGVVRLTIAIAWRSIAIGAVALGTAVLYIAAILPPPEELLDGRARGSVTMLDRDNRIFAWRGEQFGQIVRPQAATPDLINAIIASEDRRFYRHWGISPRGIASAMRINMAEGRNPLSGHGGSTLTQQTAKLICLGVPFDPQIWKSEADYELDCRRTTLTRKIKEAAYALAMEIRYTKDEILTIYLNRAFLGAGARGFEAASQRYFGKSVDRLTTSEAAMLAGLLPAPSRYAPTNNLQRSQDRAATVLRLMAEQQYITAAERSAAMKSPATLTPASSQRTGGYFSDWIMSTGPEFFTRTTTEDVMISTTFDPRIQGAVEAGVEQVFSRQVRSDSKAETAVVVMDRSGAVRAMLGGRDMRVRGVFNRATQAHRQTGSVFKSFVYAAAMEQGMRPSDIVLDAPLCLDVPGSRSWCPRNYRDEYFGEVTLSEAFARSLNMPAVRVSQEVGLEGIREVASGFGLGEELAVGPALALGASEATLLDIVAAYGGLLDGGRQIEPYGLLDLRLRDEAEPLMGQTGGIGARIIHERSARALIAMMYQTVELGTGRRAKIAGWEIAGKSGTTQEARDAWFIGFTADHVIGVWMGYDDNTPLTGVTGGGLPADIWREIVQRMVADQVAQPLPMARSGMTPVGSFVLSTPQMSGQENTATLDHAIQGTIRNLLDGITR